MGEIDAYTFDYKEVATALIKQQGLHEGIWTLTVEFGLAAANIGGSENDLKPSAIVAIVKLGLKKTEVGNNLSVDAAKVNPMKTE
jgi:hypothetical protein